jgi:hypothetical protein
LPFQGPFLSLTFRLLLLLLSLTFRKKLPPSFLVPRRVWETFLDDLFHRLKIQGIVSLK